MFAALGWENVQLFPAVLQVYSSSTKGVCPKFPLAAIDFWPETNFFAAFK